MDLDFNSLEPIRVPVKYGGKDYLLCEADGEASAHYDDAKIACHKYDHDTGRLLGVPLTAHLEPLMVSLCLYEVDGDGKPGQRVPEEVVRSWPGRVVSRLFDKAMTISEKDETNPAWLERQIASMQARLDAIRAREVAAKNGRSATAIGSA